MTGDRYILDIGSNHAPYRANDEEYATYIEAETAAKETHNPDWAVDRCVIIRNLSTGRAVGYTEYLNGRVTIRPA